MEQQTTIDTLRAELSAAKTKIAELQFDIVALKEKSAAITMRLFDQLETARHELVVSRLEQITDVLDRQ